MNPNNKKSNLSVLIGAAFLMATSAIGPGFMTQTAAFTSSFKADFAFVIVVSVILSYIAQINVWSIIAVSKMRGQDIANKVLPGLGYFIAFLVALGGLAFNIGNIGGAALGLNVIFGLDVKTAAAISGVLGIILFISVRAMSFVDQITKYFGIIMIVLIAYVAFVTSPPVGQALTHAVMPDEFRWFAIITLVGGTVGGYITFSGGHRLIDAGITGEESLKEVQRSAQLGMVVSTLVRIFLFLAVLGVVSAGVTLDPKNPAGDAFLQGAGVVGYKIFGIVFFLAAITSVVGAAYTSVSFLKTLFPFVQRFENMWIMGFIALSTLVLVFIGSPVKLLILAGSLNGLILPMSLAIILLATKKKAIVGEYKHSPILFYLGWAVVVITAYIGALSLQGLQKLLN